jgi:manganese transport protein
MKFHELFGKKASWFSSFELFRYIGPGFFVTVGFIDPGNWVTNVTAGSRFGYSLLWVVTLSTIILIIVQHNAAHLGIVTGLCLAEAAATYFKPWLRILMLGSALLACVATALAELLGAAIGLNMLFRLPVWLGTFMAAGFSTWMLFSKNYQRLEKWIMGFVSLIGLAFVFELWLADVAWGKAALGWVVPSIPPGSMAIIMGVLGAVVMPHNIFLHSEVIQSRQWNAQGDEVIEEHLKYEFYDTLAGMGVGWAINSAMIIMAAAVFFANGIPVTDLSQVTATIEPIFGSASSRVFALGLVFAGLSSSVTAAMAGGSVFAGIYREPFDMADNHSRVGLAITLFGATGIILVLADPFKGIFWSQVALSIQLPLTIIPLILLTSSDLVMGRYANRRFTRVVLWLTGSLVIALNLLLLRDVIRL